jgi:hypothetical protein
MLAGYKPLFLLVGIVPAGIPTFDRCKSCGKRVPELFHSGKKYVAFGPG